MSVVTVTKENFASITESEKTVLLDFWASWCGPCRMVSPVVDEIAEENPQYLVGKVNVDEEAELTKQFEIRNIPTLIVMKGGQVVSRTVGAIPKEEILALLEN